MINFVIQDLSSVILNTIVSKRRHLKMNSLLRGQLNLLHCSASVFVEERLGGFV